VPAGWLVQDAAVVALSGRPQNLLELAPHSLGALVAGGLFGLLVARRRAVLGAALGATAVWSALPRLTDVPFSHIEAWLPRALFLLVTAYALALALGRGRLGRARTGFLLGILGAALLGWLREGRVGPHEPLTWAAAGAVPVALLPRAGLRWSVHAVLAAAVAWTVVPKTLESLAPSRPDLAPSTAAAPPGSPNLLLVILDTVRADRLAPYGYERTTTPGLDRLVDGHFTIYDSARSTSSWTLPSHASLFTGLLPAEHGATHSGLHAHPIKEGTPTLAQHLYEAGYQTGGIFANNVYLRPRFGLDVGFERFDDRLAGLMGNYLPLGQLLGARPRIGRLGYRGGDVISALALDWLDERRTDQPFFLALNYMDAHAPHIPPAPFDTAFDDEVPNDPLSPGPELLSLLYDRELLHLDSHLVELLEELRERGLFESTVVIVTSDHGEGLGDHEFDFHGWVLYEALVRVPLYVKPAGSRTASRSSEIVNGTDVYRKCFELVGLEPPPAPERDDPPQAEWYVIPDGVGGPFVEQHPDRDLTQDLLAWVDGSRKMIVSNKGPVEAYDLVLDPQELSPLELTPQEEAAARARAAAWWAAYDVVAPPAAVLNEDALERMRKLGYIDDEDQGEEAR
jgi:arylsulfatase A-like enzyme